VSSLQSGNLALAIDLARAANAASLPPVPGDRIWDVARGIDEVYWRILHKAYKPKGRFVQRNPMHTLEEVLVIPGSSVPYTDPWGGPTDTTSPVSLGRTRF